MEYSSQLKMIVGIGRSTAIALAEAGWSLVLFARRADKLQDTQAQCPNPDKVLLVNGDVTDEVAVVGLFKSAVQRFGGQTNSLPRRRAMRLT